MIILSTCAILLAVTGFILLCFEHRAAFPTSEKPVIIEDESDSGKNEGEQTNG